MKRPSSRKNILVQMARFRNRVVHLYQEVNEGELYQILREGLGDFQAFIAAIVKKYY